MTVKHKAPFAADHVGSFLRPEKLKKARADYEAGNLSKAVFDKMVDEEVLKIVEKQKEIGIYGITDGEFRRKWWHTGFLENLDGVEGYETEAGYAFKGVQTKSYNVRIVNKVAFNPNHPFLTDFEFLNKAVGNSGEFVAKATIPSPNMLVRQAFTQLKGQEGFTEVYPNPNDFFYDLGATYQAAVKAFYEKGCRYLQFDDTNWAFLVDDKNRQQLKDLGVEPEKFAKKCAEIVNHALTNKPSDMVITTHVCRGNFASSWIFSGGYGPIAKEMFSTNYDGFFLEYDNDRAGDFEPLKYWQNNGSKVVLGLITSKFPQLEDKSLVKARINEASNYIPLENLCLSPQCGFASTEEGNHLTEEEQWNKMKLVKEIATEVWG